MLHPITETLAFGCLGGGGGLRVNLRGALLPFGGVQKRLEVSWRDGGSKIQRPRKTETQRKSPLPRTESERKGKTETNQKRYRKEEPRQTPKDKRCRDKTETEQKQTEAVRQKWEKRQ